MVNTPHNMIHNLTAFALKTDWIIKLLALFTIWITPVIPLFLLLVGIISLDYILDCIRLLRDRKSHKEPIKHLLWNQTKIWLWKFFAYSALALLLNGLHLYLFMGTIEIIRWVMAIPIISESIGIMSTIEVFTGVKIVATVKNLVGSWFKKGSGEALEDIDKPSI